MEKQPFQKRPVTDDEFYSPDFNKYVSYEVNQEYYPLIGELVAVFNSLEDSLTEELIELIDNHRVPNLGWLIISDFSFSAKWSLWVRMMLHLLHEPESEIETDEERKFVDNTTKTLKSYRTKFEKFGKIRNAVVHGTWEFMTEQGLVKTKTLTDKNYRLVHEHVEMNTKALDSLIDEIEEFDREFQEFGKRIRKIIDENQ